VTIDDTTLLAPDELEGKPSGGEVSEVKSTTFEESSESTISVRSDDNLTEQSDTGRESNKGSPVKKPDVVYESLEASTEEVCVHASICVCVCLCVRGWLHIKLTFWLILNNPSLRAQGEKVHSLAAG